MNQPVIKPQMYGGNRNCIERAIIGILFCILVLSFGTVTPAQRAAPFISTAMAKSQLITVPLRASANNPNYFFDGSGTAVYLTGSHSEWWNSHLISLTRSYEAGKPRQHPIGYGVSSDNNEATILNSDADWIAPAARISPTASCGRGLSGTSSS